MKSALFRQKPTRSHFRIPYEYDKIEMLLYNAIAAEIDYRRMEFRDSKDLAEQIHQVALWLCGQSNKNSLVITGPCGNGKTTFVYAIQNIVNFLKLVDLKTNEHIGISFHNARELANFCKTSNPMWKKVINRNVLAIDDLGTEPRETIEYGNVLSPIVDLISKRYDEQLSTIFTTNLLPKQISEVYGQRIADRLREEAEIVSFLNSSYRSIK